MVECEYAENCSSYKPRKCNEEHIGCLRRDLSLEFDTMEEAFKNISAIPRADLRYGIFKEIKEVCNTMFKRLEEILGAEKVGEIMRDAS